MTNDHPLRGVSPNSRFLGLLFVVSGILFQATWLGWPASLVSVGWVVCFVLWLSPDWRITPRLRTTYFIGVAVFLLHVAEEYTRGLQVALPGLFDISAWSGQQYLIFNGVWALVFVAAGVMLKPGRELPVLMVLFLGLVGGVANGIIHLVLVVGRGEYFPGAWTAPISFVIGVVLLRELYSSRSDGDPGQSRR
jgi:hypothetical protein